MKSIPLYKFYKHKYGSELLVDVIDIDVMKADISQTSVYRTSFYSIILFTEDSEEYIAINEQKQCVRKGMVACSRPGDIWLWPADNKLKGVHLLFEEEFLLSFFNDPLFLNKFVYLHPDRPSPFLYLGEDLFERLLYLYKHMKSEIDSNSSKDQHLLRAMLYETLTLMNRAENIVSPTNTDTEIASLRYIAAFQKYVDENFATHCDVNYYADLLCITPNYLNKIINKHLGISTKQYILNRTINEAKRLLVYTTLSITEISERLHFNTVSYFVRLFHKNTGLTPSRFREDNQQ